MDLKVRRYDLGKNDTIGEFSINGKVECFTLEDEVRKNGEKVYGETAIPYGTYKIGLRHSPKFSPVYGHEMLWIKDVKNFEYVLIHPGNTEDDTHGCLLVGAIIGIVKGKRAILNSKSTYYRIYKIIRAALDKEEEVTITFV